MVDGSGWRFDHQRLAERELPGAIAPRIDADRNAYAPTASFDPHEGGDVMSTVRR